MPHLGLKKQKQTRELLIFRIWLALRRSHRLVCFFIKVLMPKQKDLISLAEISELTPYSAGELFALAEAGALRSVEEGGGRCTTIAWVNEYLKNQGGLLTLAEAARFSQYSAEYLKLRIRQGKLRGEKIGRAWHTRREWVEAYEREQGVAAVGETPAPETEGVAPIRGALLKLQLGMLALTLVAITLHAILPGIEMRISAALDAGRESIEQLYGRVAGAAVERGEERE